LGVHGSLASKVWIRERMSVSAKMRDGIVAGIIYYSSTVIQ
jgi:hypothetical protein